MLHAVGSAVSNRHDSQYTMQIMNESSPGIGKSLVWMSPGCSKTETSGTGTSGTGTSEGIGTCTHTRKTN